MNKIFNKSCWLSIFALILLGLCTGCMNRLSNTANLFLRPPTLLSLQQLEYQGNAGAWMDNSDALALTIWRDLMDGIFKRSTNR